MNKWFYFGCHGGPGHCLWTEGMHKEYRQGPGQFDGSLAPQGSRDPYIASVSRLGGWGMTALAWWDYSVDTRGGSNSIIFAPGLDINATLMLVEAQRRFPQVFSRLPRAVTLA